MFEIGWFVPLPRLHVTYLAMPVTLEDVKVYYHTTWVTMVQIDLSARSPFESVTEELVERFNEKLNSLDLLVLVNSGQATHAQILELCLRYVALRLLRVLTHSHPFNIQNGVRLWSKAGRGLGANSPVCPCPITMRGIGG